MPDPPRPLWVSGRQRLISPPGTYFFGETWSQLRPQHRRPGLGLGLGLGRGRGEAVPCAEACNDWLRGFTSTVSGVQLGREEVLLA